jgi:hypothetical protein
MNRKQICQTEKIKISPSARQRNQTDRIFSPKSDAQFSRQNSIPRFFPLFAEIPSFLHTHISYVGLYGAENWVEKFGRRKN